MECSAALPIAGLSAGTSRSTWTVRACSAAGRCASTMERALVSPATTMCSARVRSLASTTLAASSLAFSSHASSALRWWWFCDQPPDGDL